MSFEQREGSISVERPRIQRMSLERRGYTNPVPPSYFATNRTSLTPARTMQQEVIDLTAAPDTSPADAEGRTIGCPEVIDVDALPSPPRDPAGHQGRRPPPLRPPLRRNALPPELEDYLLGGLLERRSVGGGVFRGRPNYNFDDGHITHTRLGGTVPWERTSPYSLRNHPHHHHHRHPPFPAHVSPNHHYQQPYHVSFEFFQSPNLDYSLAAHHLFPHEDDAYTDTSSALENYIPPPPPRQGFTRNPRAKDCLVCPECDGELSTGDSVKRTVYATKCGHVYCGECATKRKQVRGNKTSMCAVDGCKQRISARGLVEVYI